MGALYDELALAREALSDAPRRQEDLAALGAKGGPMDGGTTASRTDTVDVGQVFFGQFIDHDIGLTPEAHPEERFDVEIQPQMILLHKTLFNIEGLGRQLYPELDLWETAHPVLKQWMSEQVGPKAVIDDLREALPLLRESAAGKIVFLLEDMEKVAGALWGAYGVGKHALATLAVQLAEETRSSGIEVRAVNPGPVRSDVRARVYHSENPQQVAEPANAALRIMDFLDGRSRWSEVIVDLSLDG